MYETMNESMADSRTPYSHVDSPGSLSTRFFFGIFSFIASPFVCWFDLQTVGLHLGPALHLFFIFDGSATFSATFTAL